MVGEKAQELLSKSLQFLDQCYKDVETDKAVDLKLFEKDVQVLCKEVAGLGREQAVKLGFEQGLDELNIKLGRLQEKMIEKRDTIATSLGQLNQQQKAHKAYSKNKDNKTE